MKKILLVLMILVVPNFVYAAPFLICDSVPTSQVQPSYYHLVKDGGATEDSPAQVQGDNSVRLHYDLSGVSNGAHNWSVAACNEWGCSSTVPFGYAKAVPGAPANLRLSSN